MCPVFVHGRNRWESQHRFLVVQEIRSVVLCCRSHAGGAAGLAPTRARGDIMNREKSHPGKGLPSMPVVIPDETLRDAGLTEREALIEIACRLFAAGKLALSWACGKTARETRAALEQALRDRQLAVYCPDELDLADDIRCLDRAGIWRSAIIAATLRRSGRSAHLTLLGVLKELFHRSARSHR